MSQQHISDEALERYAMGTLGLDSVGEVEEHLLGCPSCQGRLVEADEFLALFRTAAAQVEAREVPWWRGIWMQRKIAFAAVTGAAAMLLIFLNVRAPRAIPGAPATVILESMRGPESSAHIASGRPYLLMFDVAPSEIGADLEVEVVDSAGNPVLTARGEQRNGRVTASITKLARGSYWVRVYRKSSALEIIAEYALEAQ